MKKIKFFNYSVIALIFSAAIFACTGEEGPIGPAGPAGPAGSNGVDGTDGTNGTNGVDGTNGIDGTDGNANVQTFKFVNPSWTGSYWMDLNTEFTDQEIEENVILGYIQLAEKSQYTISIPGSNPDFKFINYLFNSNVATTRLSGTYRILCYEEDGGILANADLPEISMAKLVVIEGTGVTTKDGNGRFASRKEAVLQELRAANVDISNYNEVCNYYGIAAY
ncbi:hypothetical protein [uncultured Arcticibacterium sp.]|uniref:hypothetical protein n=1 Tax=uncultured Arcticibacterium sp. TaxID=2173042 RepID=UPI0030F81A4B